MKIDVANRLNGIGEYYFSQKLREIEEMNKAGAAVINLGIGSPDGAPDADVIHTLQTEAAKPTVHAYQSYKGVAALREAIADWYQRWYGVALDAATEILPLIGSKEGILHLCMTYLNEGDEALIPNPGYPTYRSAVTLAGGRCVEYKLKAENNWLPDFEQLEKLVAAPSRLSAAAEGVSTQPSLVGEADENTTSLQSEERITDNRKKSQKEVESSQSGPCSAETSPLGEAGGGRVKMMWVNYPHMPTGQLPTKGLFEQLIAFGRKHNVLICHDNPYSFILNEKPLSLLSLPGAKEVAVELNSLSKSHNMAGWRVGMLCGAKERIEEVLRFKSNMDSGMFFPVQIAAAKALSLGEEWHEMLNEQYRQRREKVFELLDSIGCSYSKTQAGLFVWARISPGYKDGFALSNEILHKAKVFLTPGGIFGSEGDNYIRVSLCSSVEKLSEAIARIQNAKQNKP